MHFNHHTLMSLLKRVIQLWTDRDVPSGVETTHDFKDGRGAIPAVPIDNTGMRNGIVYSKADFRFYGGSPDNAGIRNDIISSRRDFRFYLGNPDNAGMRNDIVQAKMAYQFHFGGTDNAGMRNELVSIQQI